MLDGTNITGVIKNQTSQQANADFNISGTGTIGGNATVAGSVGIGTTTPGQKLEVAGNIKITGPGNGLTFADGTAQTTAATGGAAVTASNGLTRTGNDIALGGTLTHTTSIATGGFNLGLTGTGNVGLGTATPGSRLAVVAADNSTNPIADFQPQNLTQGVSITYNGIAKTGSSATSNLTLDGKSTGHVLLHTNGSTGNVGIGTSSPVAKLHVDGGADATPTGSYTFFSAGSGSLGTTSIATVRSVAAYFTGGQLWVNGAIVAGALTVTSDRRIKRVVGLSERAADLALLNRLRITDYAYIDQHANTNQVVKKVIAQEVQQVLPAAVSQSRQAIPNVYERAARVSFANGTLTLTTAKPHELPAAGGTLRLYTPQNQELTVQATVVDAHTVRFASTEAHAAGLFVYGKYVDDFLSVDYDALTTLNVSATQELARKVAALEQQNAALKASTAADRAAAATDHASLLTLQAQMARLLGEQPTASQARAGR